MAKGLSISPLALLAWRELVPGRSRVLLAAALALGSLGDVLLDLGPAWFTAGLGSFLAGHLLYTWLWSSHWRRPVRPTPGQLLRVTLVLIFCAALAAILAPRLGPLTVPVIFYMAAISAMAAASALAPFSSSRIFWGAVLFVFSDAVIAVNRFHTPLPGRDWLVWSTYYAAQLAIAGGYVRQAARAPSLAPIAGPAAKSALR